MSSSDNIEPTVGTVKFEMTIETQLHILCYGDSNTWGWPPSDWRRHPQDQRWPCVLETSLGDGYHIIEAGEPGRTTISDLEIFGEEDAVLSRYLNSGSRVGLVILMLGTNDIIVRPAHSAADITSDLGVLVGWVQMSKEGLELAEAQVLILSPPHLEQDAAAQFAGLDEIMVDKSHQLSELYQGLAEEKGCAFFDAAGVIRSSSIDGVHLDANAHITLGQALAPICRKLLA